MRQSRTSTWLWIALVALAAVCGVLLYALVIALQAGVSKLGSYAPQIFMLAVNAFIEEAARLGFAIGCALFIGKFKLQPGIASLAVVSSCVLAAFENASYLARFPTLDVYWRLGYAVPIHAGAALLYAIVTAMPLRMESKLPARFPASMGRVFITAVSFIAAWTWHSVFNVLASLSLFRVLPIVGTALNLLALTALVVASAIRSGYWSLHARR